MSILNEAKQRYNSMLQRCKKAEQYLDNLTVSQAEKEKWLPEYVDLLEAMNSFISKNILSGNLMTPDEIIEGFKEVMKSE